jgi:hypothetical protein
LEFNPGVLGIDGPELLGLFLLYKLAVMPEQDRLRVARLQGGLGGVLVCSQIVAAIGMAQTIMRPFLKPHFCLGHHDQGVPPMIKVGRVILPPSLSHSKQLSLMSTNLLRRVLVCFSLKFNLAIGEGDVCLSHTCDLGWTDAAKQIQRHRR